MFFGKTHKEILIQSGRALHKLNEFKTNITPHELSKLLKEYEIHTLKE